MHSKEGVEALQSIRLLYTQSHSELDLICEALTRSLLSSLHLVIFRFVKCSKSAGGDLFRYESFTDSFRLSADEVGQILGSRDCGAGQNQMDIIRFVLCKEADGDADFA